MKSFDCLEDRRKIGAYSFEWVSTARRQWDNYPFAKTHAGLRTSMGSTEPDARWQFLCGPLVEAPFGTHFTASVLGTGRFRVRRTLCDNPCRRYHMFAGLVSASVVSLRHDWG